MIFSTFLKLTVIWTLLCALLEGSKNVHALRIALSLDGDQHFLESGVKSPETSLLFPNDVYPEGRLTTHSNEEEKVRPIRPNTNSQRDDMVSMARQSFHEKFELAVAFDNSFCALFGNNRSAAIAQIRGIIQEANIPFETQASLLTLDIVHIDGHCKSASDPYAHLRTLRGLDSYAMLDALERHWRAKKGLVKRAAVVLFVGWTHAHFWGQANIGSTCDGLGFAWVEADQPRALAHEIGHLLNCTHVPTGIMRDGGSSADTPNVLAAASASEIREYIRTSPHAACIRGTHTPEVEDGPLPLAKVCSSAMDKVTGLSCLQKRTTLLDTGIVIVSADLSQAYGRLNLLLEIQPHNNNTASVKSAIIPSFAKYGVRLSWNAKLTQKDMAKKVNTPSKNTNTARRKWNLSTWPVPTSGRGCCDQMLFVYIFFKARRMGRKYGIAVERSARRFSRIPWTVPCLSCTPSILRASSTRRCSICP